MRVPKILYHGTTILRWGFIKENGVLRSDMHELFEAEKYYHWNTGYVYFTTDLDQAIMYGLRKSLLDMEFLEIPENMKLNPNYRDVAVIAVDESKLGGLEMDPGSSPTFTEATHYGNIIIFPQYRYKGDIKLKDLFMYKHRPFDTFSSNTINEMKQGVHNYHKACNILMKEKQTFDSSSSFLEVLGMMDKVKSVHDGISK